MNVLGDSIGCAVVQANVELEPVKKIEEAVEIDDATEASSSLWSKFFDRVKNKCNSIVMIFRPSIEKNLRKPQVAPFFDFKFWINQFGGGFDENSNRIRGIQNYISCGIILNNSSLQEVHS